MSLIIRQKLEVSLFLSLKIAFGIDTFYLWLEVLNPSVAIALPRGRVARDAPKLLRIYFFHPKALLQGV
jgi:hypothetical protein